MLPGLLRSYSRQPTPFPWGKGNKICWGGDDAASIPPSLALRGATLGIEGFAQLEADEAAHFDLFAHLECRLDQQIVYGLVGIAHVSLFEQAGFLEELLDLAVDDFADHGGR